MGMDGQQQCQKCISARPTSKTPLVKKGCLTKMTPQKNRPFACIYKGIIFLCDIIFF